MAFWIGATAPEQVGPIVAVDGMPYFPALLDRTATPQSATPQAEGMRKMFRGETPEQFVFGLRIYLGGAITDVKDVEKVVEWSAKSDRRAVGQAFYDIMTIDLRPKVGAIRSPVLVLGATAALADPEQKKRTEDNYRAEVATIARHKVVFAPKARHFIQLDEPEYFFREAEKFLKETDAK